MRRDAAPAPELYPRAASALDAEAVRMPDRGCGQLDDRAAAERDGNVGERDRGAALLDVGGEGRVDVPRRHRDPQVALRRAQHEGASLVHVEHVASLAIERVERAQHGTAIGAELDVDDRGTSVEEGDARLALERQLLR